MRVLKIGVKSEQEVMRDFKEGFEAAQKRLPFKPRTGVFFTSLEVARNFLTPKRLELIHLIKEKQPNSIYELAKIAKRNFPSVLRDTELLRKHGLIKLTKDKRSPRRSVHPAFDYDAISLWISV